VGSWPSYVIDSATAQTPTIDIYGNTDPNRLAIFACPRGLCVFDRTSPAFGVDLAYERFAARQPGRAAIRIQNLLAAIGSR
jgi:hypothetical protein